MKLNNKVILRAREWGRYKVADKRCRTDKCYAKGHDTPAGSYCWACFLHLPNCSEDGCEGASLPGHAGLCVEHLVPEAAVEYLAEERALATESKSCLAFAQAT